MALALIGMVACSKDEVMKVNNGKRLFFRVSMDNVLTRSNEVSRVNLKSFEVAAIGDGKNFFSTPVTSSDNGESWKTSSTYYWPEYPLEFFAFSPANICTVDITPDHQKIIGFTPASSVKDHKDLVIACNTGDKTNESEGVPLNFKHALSQIYVQAKCPNDKIKIEVLGLKIVNVATCGDFTFPTQETDSQYMLEQGLWSVKEANKPENAYMTKGDKAITLEGKPKSILFSDNSFMLLPQQLTGWDGSAAKTGAYLSVLCRISSLNNTEETQLFPATASKYGFTAVAIDTNWKPGYKYVYTLEFCGEGGGAGKMDPNPTNPTDPQDPDVDPIPGTPGKPILGKPIKFTVEVEQWQTEAKDIEM